MYLSPKLMEHLADFTHVIDVLNDETANDVLKLYTSETPPLNQCTIVSVKITPGNGFVQGVYSSIVDQVFLVGHCAHTVIRMYSANGKWVCYHLPTDIKLFKSMTEHDVHDYIASCIFSSKGISIDHNFTMSDTIH